MTDTDEHGHPLGYCRVCFRVRWLAEVDEGQTSPVGVCTQCEREEKQKGGGA